jgi:N,N-dimethylformamidase
MGIMLAPDFAPSWLEKISAWNAYPNNPSEYRHYGLSTYNNHTDGSGICHASHKRVLFNLRPGYLTFGEASCSGLRHFQADSHLIAWLHNQDIAYDIVTDDELDRDGVAAISGYKAVLTGSHPEYHTSATLDALKDYRDNGGGLIYLGGNGFYWRIVRHSEEPTLLEIRRSEDGLRAWASEPGEYYNAFDGSYGGLWRRNGRPPQKLVGIGFTAQGNFVGMPYKRVNYDKNMDWVFDGINGELLGDFGFSGHGAAGFELDRRDEKLDEGEDIITLAQSYDEGNRFILVPEEMLTHLTNLSGSPEADAKRADMVYFKDSLTADKYLQLVQSPFAGHCLGTIMIIIFQRCLEMLCVNLLDLRINPAGRLAVNPVQAQRRYEGTSLHHALYQRSVSWLAFRHLQG